METRKRAIAFRKFADIDIPKQEKVKPYFFKPKGSWQLKEIWGTYQ
jgi:hypothetical protein